MWKDCGAGVPSSMHVEAVESSPDDRFFVPFPPAMLLQRRSTFSTS
jgi:hypothetical protein